MPVQTPVGLNLIMLLADHLVEEGKSLINRPEQLWIDDKQAPEIAETFKRLSKDFSNISAIMKLKSDLNTKFSLETSEDGVCFIVNDSD